MPLIWQNTSHLLYNKEQLSGCPAGVAGAFGWRFPLRPVLVCSKVPLGGALQRTPPPRPLQPASQSSGSGREIRSGFHLGAAQEWVSTSG